MVEINYVFMALCALFRDLHWDEPNDENYKLLSDVNNDLNGCADCNNYINQDIRKLQEYLYDQYLDERETGYDKRGRTVIDVAVDSFETNA